MDEREAFRTLLIGLGAVCLLVLAMGFVGVVMMKMGLL